MSIILNILTMVLGLSAIFSPVITAYLNNNHALRMKRIENFEKEKLLAFQNLIDCVYNLVKDTNEDTILNYYSAVSKVYLYIPQKDCSNLYRIDEKLECNQKLNIDDFDYIMRFASDLGKENITNYQANCGNKTNNCNI